MFQRKATTPQPIFSPEDTDLAQFWWSENKGYSYRRISGKNIHAHRIVLARMVGRDLGRWDMCDHINGNGLDNRRQNLRLTTHRQNLQNRQKNEFRGVSWKTDRNKWRASVTSDGEYIHVGYFDTKEEAAAAALKKRAELGFLTNVVP